MNTLLLTIYAGFTHAFETDHLLAVSSIVTGRDRIKMAAKDGLYWGLGHTSTILLTGLLMLALKMQISEHIFRYFEAAVGAMLIILALHRLWRSLQKRSPRPHTHTPAGGHGHRVAYGVGMVHGLAGSGALVVLFMAEAASTAQGLLFLLIFGLGSVAGMLLAATLFHIPLSKKLLSGPWLRLTLVLLSSLLCLWYGGKVLYENLNG